MRLLIQRVSQASVTIDDCPANGEQVHREIDNGLLVFCGVRHGDTEDNADYLASRTARLRIFNDDDGKMNLSLLDNGGAALVISQFTLHADTRKGNRPSYGHAAEPALAEQLYERFVGELRRQLGDDRVQTGVFGAMMKVALINDGPVTVMLRSKDEYTDRTD
jgi:D-aminoacyl-tRNA deacylase